MRRRTFLPLTLLPLAPLRVMAQPYPDPFRPAEYTTILREHNFQADYEALAPGDQIYVPPPVSLSSHAQDSRGHSRHRGTETQSTRALGDRVQGEGLHPEVHT